MREEAKKKGEDENEWMDGLQNDVGKVDFGNFGDDMEIFTGNEKNVKNGKAEKKENPKKATSKKSKEGEKEDSSQEFSDVELNE